MKTVDFPIGSKVELIREYSGLQKGCTGEIVDIDMFDDVTITNIQGDYIPYCEDCDSYDCCCLDIEDYQDNHCKNEREYVPIKYLKVISVPQTDTLILLL